LVYKGLLLIIYKQQNTQIMITLKGKEVRSKLQILPDEFAYGSNTKMAGKKYHRAVYNGTAFTVPADIFGEWREGKLAEFTIVEGTRTVTIKDEAEGTEETRDIPQLSYGGSIGWNALKNIVTNESELKVIEAKAVKELHLTSEMVAELEKNA
jgi:hypothetical protein